MSGKPAVTDDQTRGAAAARASGTGMFKVSGGKIVDPHGAPYRVKGVNVCYTRPWASDGRVDITRVTRSVLQRSFPGINFVRFANWAGALCNPADATVQRWINDLTSEGIVVAIDLHYTGDAVSPTDATANNWLAACASRYRANPRVWFDLQNEPHGAGYAISRMQRAQYNAIRATGNAAPIMLCAGNPGAETTGLDKSIYAQMTNVAFDAHYYGWMPSNGVTWAEICAQLSGYTSRDGAIPVCCLEFGDATDGKRRDGNWRQVIREATGNPDGYAAWLMNWTSYGADNLLAPPFDGSGLTDYGQIVATAIRVG